jgi:hypothetical protein
LSVNEASNQIKKSKERMKRKNETHRALFIFLLPIGTSILAISFSSFSLLCCCCCCCCYYCCWLYW